MRIALARLLLSKPDLLLLDEPSNHLDAAARAWLADFLAECAESARARFAPSTRGRAGALGGEALSPPVLAPRVSRYDGTLVLVSHDSAMLRRACDSIAEVVGARDEVQAAGGGQVEDLGPCRQLETYKSCSYEKWRAERAARAAR